MKAFLILTMMRLLHLQHPTPQQLVYFNKLSEADIEIGQTYNVDPLLIVVMQFRESSLRQYKVSKDRKDIGGLQIRTRGAAKGYAYSRSELFDPWINTDIGIRYLRRQINRCGGVTRGLSAYNRGHCTKDLTYGRKTMALYGRLLKNPALLAVR